jgi:hypothetical protein
MENKDVVLPRQQDPLEIIQALQDKRAAAVEPRKRPAAKEKQQKKQTSKVANEKKLAKASTQTPKVAKKKGKTKAAVATKAKTPAIKNQKNTSAAQVPGFSMQKRLLLRPNGCSKCRLKPGCTPSCLRGVNNCVYI